MSQWFTTVAPLKSPNPRKVRNLSAVSFQKFASPKTQFRDKRLFSFQTIIVNITSFNDTEKKVRNKKVRYTTKDEFQTKKNSHLCILKFYFLLNYRKIYADFVQLQTSKKIEILLLVDSKYFYHLQTSKQINILKFCFANFLGKNLRHKKVKFLEIFFVHYIHFTLNIMILK